MNKKLPRNTKSLGSRIQALRKSKQFTLAELGKKVGVSHVQVSNYEKGEIPNAIVILKLAEVLDTSVEHLMKGDQADYLKDVTSRINNLSLQDKEALLRVISGFINSRELLRWAAKTIE
jgi:transcriptional regulator with XRE-family HTH domain